MKPLRLTLALCAAAAALAGAACGGDDEPDKFVEEANRVCRESEEKIEDAGADPERLIAASEEFVRDLKAVDVPDDKKADYDAWVAIQAKYVEEATAAIEARDEEAIDGLDDTAGDDQARDLDLDDCTG